MKVFIIGGSGFIGSKLVEILLQKSYRVTIFDKVISKKFPDITIIGDVRDLKALSRAMNNHDVVINLAAEHRDDVDPISLYYEVNVLGMKNTLIASELNNISRIVFTSTVAVYPLDIGNPDENTEPAPFNDYGNSKLKAEKLLLEWAEKFDNSCLIVRPCVVIGEGNKGNVYNLIKQIHSGYFIMIGDGNNKKSMCYVENLVSFIKDRMNHTQTELINFADKPDLKSIEIVRIIYQSLRKSESIKTPIRLPYWLGLLGGLLFDLLAKLFCTKLPISSIRIKKFTANTTINTSRLADTGYSSPILLSKGLINMVEKDFTETSHGD